MANHLRFLGRTVMVQNGNVEAAYGALNRILSHDGLLEAVRRRRYYEKPCRRRQRLAYEACRRVYNAEMGRKIGFLARGSRQDPWPGC
ncbi:UNVERIFIED_CONTAM: 28S ribosomal protein S21, mitochondrial, partial [Eudyptes pachyrhynchus]